MRMGLPKLALLEVSAHESPTPAGVQIGGLSSGLFENQRQMKWAGTHRDVAIEDHGGHAE